MEHKLKMIPKYFNAVKSGERAFDVRDTERNIQVGDTIIFQESDSNLISKENEDGLTGREIEVDVTYVLKDKVSNYDIISFQKHCFWRGWTAEKWTKRYDDNGDPEYKPYTYYSCQNCCRRTVIKEKYCPSCGYKMKGVK